MPRSRTSSIGGPYVDAGAGDTPSRRRIFTCTPAAGARERDCARTILSTLARRAFRRPATDADVGALLTFYDAARREDSDAGFEGGIQRALERLLMDPEFLFRIEHDPANAARRSAYRVSDIELASRLSFFLWSSIPDDELLDLASRNRLSQRAALEQQARRMFNDVRARRALVGNFAGQWLELRNIREHTPDPDTFDEFDENLREAMRRETELFLESQLSEDRSVVELLNADYTFMNERLARHYGIPGVYGERFRRVPLGADRDYRRGLLGQASLLTVTSYPNRTSPVLRGKWVLGNMLGAPPPPPPPDVNTTLADKDASGRPVSVRARLEEHRQNPTCAMCHAQMDPLGFALENFDAMGRWRTVAEGDSEIDASGGLVDGSQFAGPAGLRTILLDRREQFVTTVTEKLLSYALGRRLEAFDQPAVRKIVRDAAAENYRWSSLVRGHRHERAVSDEESGIMMITNKPLSRRTMLRAAGATLALPLLDSMIPAWGGTRVLAAQAPRRLGVVYVPNGMMMPFWTPETEGPGFAFKPIMQPLEPFRDHLRVISGPQWRREHRRACRRVDAVSDRCRGQALRFGAGRRRIDGSGRRQGTRAAHAVRLAGAGARGARLRRIV